jgi:protein-L-isoaspartate(D-aspartate) O-methyltransferase
VEKADPADSLALAPIRHAYAEKLRIRAGLRSERLARAFATVPREAFLGPGPWQILRLGAPARGYEPTPDADPRHLYDNVLVALDASRHLNNGEPAALARWLDDLELREGESLLHVGCGVGYYTAVAAEAVSATGRVVGVEIDGALAARAAANLARWPQVEVVAEAAHALQSGAFDAVFVNAGATELSAAWLDALREGGRLLVPLTVDLPQPNLGAGHMLLVTRRRAEWAARFVSPVGIFHCAGARTSEGHARLRRAFDAGGHEEVQSLRCDAHREEPACWLHAAAFCLSRRRERS